ncbi:hypothetical protein TNIN_353271 [Trichonephila inaurata madagascariensis]|uniref:Uncharacterized protein n=1 Tax=Trichonephila inaurata madagascariensis TaxID=2747483 RepID=A0A8X7BY60_9ARAC|nr:hypothetical protein TNIN_353271 [Trichonephila inaurata madagascariensis]
MYTHCRRFGNLLPPSGNAFETPLNRYPQSRVFRLENYFQVSLVTKYMQKGSSRLCIEKRALLDIEDKCLRLYPEAAAFSKQDLLMHT